MMHQVACSGVFGVSDTDVLDDSMKREALSAEKKGGVTMKSRARVSLLVCSLAFFIQSCATLLGPGEFYVTVKGEGSDIKTFADRAASLKHGCDRNVPWPENEDATKDLKLARELVYQCKAKVHTEETSTLSKFAEAYTSVVPAADAAGGKDPPFRMTTANTSCPYYRICPWNPSQMKGWWVPCISPC